MTRSPASTATSADGTPIEWERRGTGPGLLIVDPSWSTDRPVRRPTSSHRLPKLSRW